MRSEDIDCIKTADFLVMINEMQNYLLLIKLETIVTHRTPIIVKHLFTQPGLT